MVPMMSASVRKPFGASGDRREMVRPTVDIRPGRLAFDAEHPAVALPEIAADLAAGDEAVDVVIEVEAGEVGS